MRKLWILLFAASCSVVPSAGYSGEPTRLPYEIALHCPNGRGLVVASDREDIVAAYVMVYLGVAGPDLLQQTLAPYQPDAHIIAMRFMHECFAPVTDA